MIDGEEMLRRALLTIRNGDVQALIDSAALAAAMDLHDGTEALFSLASLHLGFAPETSTLKQRLAARAAMTDEARLSPAPLPAGDVTVALAELSRLIELNSNGALPTDAIDDATLDPLFVDLPAATVPTSDLVTELAELCELLASTPDPETIAALDRQLARLAEVPRIDAPGRAGGDPADLIEAVVAGGLRQFVRSHHAIAFGPSGSAALLHAAARLSPAGLTPYFGGVWRLLRTSRDLPALIALALPDPDDRTALELWCFLLGTEQPERLLPDLLTDFADSGFTKALHAMLIALVRDAGRDFKRDGLLALRDAGLDHDDSDLSVACQRLMALRDPGSSLEWRILGDICATIGRTAAADSAYDNALILSPDDAELALRRATLGTAAFRRFEIMGGFGTRSRQRARPLVDTTPDEAPKAEFR